MECLENIYSDVRALVSKEGQKESEYVIVCILLLQNRSKAQ